jgi:FixJ family two-component response regulator
MPTISIVDDDVWARDGIRDLIESLGYNASMFASAEEFLESGIITDTSCLITDLQMQGLSGLDCSDSCWIKGIAFPLSSSPPIRITYAANRH